MFVNYLCLAQPASPELQPARPGARQAWLDGLEGGTDGQKISLFFTIYRTSSPMAATASLHEDKKMLLKKVAQRHQMVSGSLALLYFLFGFHGGRQGSGPDRGRSPVE